MSSSNIIFSLNLGIHLTPKKSGWFASFMRKYSENRAGDDRPYLNHNTVQLDYVENSIQGPHVEGGLYSTRSRYIALFCQEPANHDSKQGLITSKKFGPIFQSAHNKNT